MKATFNGSFGLDI